MSEQNAQPLDGQKTYYRTLKGSHRHLDWHCANRHRLILNGDVLELTAEEVDGYEPCSLCAADELAAWQQAQDAVSRRCPNSGVAEPRRLKSTCRDCGKQGSVNRATGKLRAHDRTDAR